MKSFYLKKLYEFLMPHKYVFIAALVMSFFVFFPVIIFPIVADSYKGINIGNFRQDEFHYFAKIKEIMEGHSLGNILLRDGKKWINPQQTYVEYIFLPARWLGLGEKVNLVTLVYTLSYLGVVGLILLIYAFIFQLSRDKRLALITALFVVGGYTFLTKYSFSSNLNIYGRPIIPLFSSLVFFLYLNFLFAGLKSGRAAYYYLAALCFGGAFYVYFYAWTYLLAFNGVLLVIYLAKRNGDLFKKVFWVTILGFILGWYEIYQLFLMTSSEMGKQILLFASGGHFHAAIIIKISFLALAMFVLYSWRNKKDENLPIVLALIISGIISINQQIVTGREVQALHYFWHFLLWLLFLPWTCTHCSLARRSTGKTWHFLHNIFLLPLLFS